MGPDALLHGYAGAVHEGIQKTPTSFGAMHGPAADAQRRQLRGDALLDSLHLSGWHERREDPAAAALLEGGGRHPRIHRAHLQQPLLGESHLLGRGVVHIGLDLHEPARAFRNSAPDKPQRVGRIREVPAPAGVGHALGNEALGGALVRSEHRSQRRARGRAQLLALRRHAGPGLEALQQVVGGGAGNGIEAMGHLHGALPRGDGTDPGLRLAQCHEARGGERHVRDGILETDLVEVDLLHGHSVDLGFRAAQGLEGGAGQLRNATVQMLRQQRVHLLPGEAVLMAAYRAARGHPLGPRWQLDVGEIRTLVHPPADDDLGAQTFQSAAQGGFEPQIQIVEGQPAQGRFEVSLRHAQRRESRDPEIARQAGEGVHPELRHGLRIRR